MHFETMQNMPLFPALYIFNQKADFSLGFPEEGQVPLGNLPVDLWRVVWELYNYVQGMGRKHKSASLQS